jgi:hypothetical protein
VAKLEYSPDLWYRTVQWHTYLPSLLDYILQHWLYFLFYNL